ncbi:MULTISPECIES: hypothetical protein [unclassified Erythrobacter]|uniref:hypothetical protein n=1 Tax=unclassified Erythrobacter TaxID=2633097 RepID=UPI00076C8975|nr:MULTISPECIES: hypothetical protein [unclassified Erythrobacter]KWV95783.1 hypothetical protein ASS64_00660 [Erythrobacter sp. AP23]MBO6768294.1 hypothetical protein [Erythrobacter sp.]
MKRIFSSIALAVIAAPTLAHETTREVVSQPDAADFIRAEAAVAPIIALIEAEDSQEAVKTAASGSALFASKRAELTSLGGQARNAVEIYGPVERCVLQSRDFTTELRFHLNYVCQHRDLLIQWKFNVDDLPAGMTITNLSFSDTF